MSSHTNEMTMVERVARAVFCAEEEIDPVRSKPRVDAIFDDGQTHNTGGREIYRLLARAAIEALREPTKELVVAVEQKIAERAAAAPDMLRMYGDDVWNAGIDAALQEQPE